jgi:MurNAc alpha-1-phosphate uridylyltransferase
MKAMLFAAGLGSRLKPFTDHHPKALAPVQGKTLLEHNFNYLKQAGITEVVVNVHHFASQIIDTLAAHQGFGLDYHISDETNAVLETGGGLLQAASFWSNQEDIVVMNVDILTNASLPKLIVHHQSQQVMATLAVQERSSSRYLLWDDNNLLCGWENVNTQEQRIAVPGRSTVAKAFSGLQIINTQLLNKIQQKGKFSMIDVYLDLCPHYPIACWDHTGDLLIDVGKPESLAHAATLFPSM